MKVLAINPNYHCGGAEIAVGILPPLGLLYSLYPVLKEGHSVKLLDAMRLNLSLEETYDYLEKESPDIVCVGSPTSTPTINRAIKILKKAKSYNPSTYTILGGLHPTFMFKEIMVTNPGIDFIVRGEGEITLRELIEIIADKNFENLNHIKGIVWRNNGKLIVNEEREKIGNLDDFKPAWELIEDWRIYKNSITKEISAAIQFSRGCPGRCNFCCLWEFWEKQRARSPEVFVDELQMLNEKYNVTFFFMADESGASNQKIWLDMLREIKRRNLNIHIFAALRVRDIVRDEEYLPLYREAGISIINLGIECITQEDLDRYGKGSKINENSLAIKLIKKNGIICVANLFVGEPHETPATLKRKFSTVRKWDPDYILPYMPMPFPWTILYKSTKDKIITYDWEKWNFMSPVLKLDNMEIDTLFRKILSNLILAQVNPKRLFKILSSKNKYLRKYILVAYLKHIPPVIGQRFENFLKKIGINRYSKSRVDNFFGDGT